MAQYEINHNVRARASMPAVQVVGRVSHDYAMDIQHSLKKKVLQEHLPGFVLLLEHDPPVITLGRRGEPLAGHDLIQEHGIQVRQVSRGGQATAHEPGQLVVYYILPVSSKASGHFVENLAGHLVSFIHHLTGLEAAYDSKRPGLWCGDRKTGSLGLDLTGGVSMHGAAINICNTLETFQYISPCGYDASIMTTLGRESGRSITMEEVYQAGETWKWV